MQQTSFYTEEELSSLGLKSYGKNVRISRFCRIYKPENIEIGNHVRIDDFCILSAGKSIQLGNYIHLSPYVSIIGCGEVVIGDYSGISGHSCVYSSSDDYTGEYMTNPTVPEELTNVNHAPVRIGKHVVVGCSSVILPGVTIEDGVAIGAMTLVQKNCKSNHIYAGNPMKKLMPRFENFWELEKKISQFD